MKRMLIFVCFFAALILPPVFAQEQGGVEISASAIRNYALKEAVSENANGKANPGETLYLDMGVKNSSPSDVYGLEVTLAVANPDVQQYVTIYKGREALGDLKAGAETSLTGSDSNSKSLMIPDKVDRAFRFSLSDRCPAGSLVFTVRFRDSEGKEWADIITIPVVPNEGEVNLAMPAARGGEGGLSRLFFSINPKLLEDGSMTDISLGYDYNNFWTSEVRVRFTRESWYEPLDEAFDKSLNAVEDSNYEFFLLPAEYFFIRDMSVDLWAEVGAYYNYHPQKEEGYFDWPLLADLPFEKSTVNAYRNEFSMNVIGPLLGGGISYRRDRVRLSASVGAVPVYFYWATQKMSLFPLMGPDYEYSQQKAGSPYLFGDLSVVLFNIVSLSAFYDFTYIGYNVVDFTLDENTYDFVWHTQDSSVISHTVKFEAALNIPLGSFSFRIGYGRFIVSTQVNSGDPLLTNKQYLLINGQWGKIR